MSQFTITPELLAAHAEWLRTKDTTTPLGKRLIVPPGVDLRGADLRRADLRRANLGGADLSGAELGGADLRGADLGGADLGGADLGGADLGSADLGDADLRCADLGGANLGGADLGGANLGCADLGGADLGDADLREAYLACANLGGFAVGHIGRYEWMSWREKDGTRVLRFGCETHPLSEWATLCEALAEKHEPEKREFYARATRALVAMCEALDAPEVRS